MEYRLILENLSTWWKVSRDYEDVTKPEVRLRHTNLLQVIVFQTQGDTAKMEQKRTKLYSQTVSLICRLAESD